MNSIKISIIMPCYNSEDFIESAICSVMSQKLDSMELLIINDGSTDKTEAVCLKYANIDSRISYYKTANLGAGHARNYGIERANGEWIVFLDADDLFLYDSIDEDLINALDQYQKNDVDIVITQLLISDFFLRKPVAMKELTQPIRLIPNIEFVSGIYSRDYLIRKQVRFFEYQQQDIESAFRFRAFNYTDKFVYDNGICFYLIRRNPKSNTQTWNLFTLHYIKALVYLELYNEFDDEEKKQWLYENVVNEIREFYICCQKTKCDNTEYFDSMDKLWKKIQRYKHKKSLSKSGKRHYYSVFMYYFKANHSKNLISCVENKDDVNNRIPENDMILKKLSIISYYIKQCVLEV